MLPSTVALYSAGLPWVRLFDAYFGRSDRISCREKRPLASKIREPLGLGPYASTETTVQLPTRSFADWAAALPADSVSPNAVITDRVRTFRRFILFLLVGYSRVKP